MRLRPALLVITFAVLVLGACSAGPDASTSTPTGVAAIPSASGSPSASATPTLTAVEWADGVCIARAELGRTLKDIVLSLKVDPTSGAKASDQVIAQLQARSDEIDAAAGALGSAIGKVPVDVDGALVAANEVQAAGEAFTAARDEAAVDLDAARNADGLLAMARAAKAAFESTQRAYDAGMAYLAVIDKVTKSSREELGAAFDAAPRCQ